MNVDSSVYNKRTSAFPGTRVIRIPGSIRLFVGNTRQAPVGAALSNDRLGTDSGILLNEIDLRSSLVFALTLRAEREATHIRVVLQNIKLPRCQGSSKASETVGISVVCASADARNRRFNSRKLSFCLHLDDIFALQDLSTAGNQYWRWAGSP